MNLENNTGESVQDSPAITSDSVSAGKNPSLVLDTSAFFLSIPLKGILFTVPRVEGELKDLRGKARFAVLMDEGMEIKVPQVSSVKRAREASVTTGDQRVLSETDMDLIALAYEVQGTIISDDFALQNTARALDIQVQSIIQRESVPRVWQIRCTGCGKYFDKMPTKAEDCPVCGSALKRKHK